MHISYESGILEDPSQPGPEDLFQMTKNPQNSPNNPIRIDIVFKNGLPVRCNNPSNGTSYEQPLHILQYLNQIGGMLVNRLIKTFFSVFHKLLTNFFIFH